MDRTKVTWFRLPNGRRHFVLDCRPRVAPYLALNEHRLFFDELTVEEVGDVLIERGTIGLGDVYAGQVHACLLNAVPNTSHSRSETNTNVDSAKRHSASNFHL